MYLPIKKAISLLLIGYLLYSTSILAVEVESLANFDSSELYDQHGWPRFNDQFIRFKNHNLSFSILFDDVIKTNELLTTEISTDNKISDVARISLKDILDITSADYNSTRISRVFTTSKEIILFLETSRDLMDVTTYVLRTLDAKEWIVDHDFIHELRRQDPDELYVSDTQFVTYSSYNKTFNVSKDQGKSWETLLSNQNIYPEIKPVMVDDKVFELTYETDSSYKLFVSNNGGNFVEANISEVKTNNLVAINNIYSFKDLLIAEVFYQKTFDYNLHSEGIKFWVSHDGGLKWNPLNISLSLDQIKHFNYEKGLFTILGYKERHSRTSCNESLSYYKFSFDELSPDKKYYPRPLLRFSCADGDVLNPDESTYLIRNHSIEHENNINLDIIRIIDSNDK